MDKEINRIHRLLQATFDGDPWHGSPVMLILEGISAQQASTRVITHAHSIWELVLHMTAWRQFTWQKLSGNATYDIATTEQDWPAVEHTDAQAWRQTLLNLKQSQQALLEILAGVENEMLEKVVPGRKYTFYVLLHGIIQHDLYHSGQIALLKKHWS